MKLSDKYYTGREVQRKLGITEPSLRNLVNQKKLRKVIPPGRKTGLYLKTDVDTFAEKWEAFLMAKEPPKLTFRLATLEDMEAEHDLDARAVGPNGMPTEARKAWLTANDESDYHVYYGDRLVAFLHLVPLKHEIIHSSMEGTISWRDINPVEAIEKYEPGKPVELFVEGIASEPDVGETLRSHYMLVLLRGVGEELKKLGQRGIIITKVYAKTQTSSGIAMAIHTGMVDYLPRKGKMVRMVLDIETNHSYLVDKYKEGLSDWKKGQENATPSHRKTQKRDDKVKSAAR